MKAEAFTLRLVLICLLNTEGNVLNAHTHQLEVNVRVRQTISTGWLILNEVIFSDQGRGEKVERVELSLHHVVEKNHI